MPVHNKKEFVLTIDQQDLHVLQTQSATVAAQTQMEELVVWHGFGTVNRFYDWALLAPYGRVTRIGLPGHGPIQQVNYAQWSPAYFFKLMNQALAQLFPQACSLTLVGFSLGGQVALGTALSSQLPVKRLILINPLLWRPFNWLSKQIVLSRLWDGLGQKRFQRQLDRRRKSLADYYADISHSIVDLEAFQTNQNIKQQLVAGRNDYQHLTAKTLREMAKVVALADIRPLVLAKRYQITFKTCLIYGDKDPTTPAQQGYWLTEHLPDIQFFLLPGIGHYAYAEAEARTTTILQAWLEQQGLQPATG